MCRNLVPLVQEVPHEVTSVEDGSQLLEWTSRLTHSENSGEGEPTSHLVHLDSVKMKCTQDNGKPLGQLLLPPSPDTSAQVVFSTPEIYNIVKVGYYIRTLQWRFIPVK